MKRVVKRKVRGSASSAMAEKAVLPAVVLTSQERGEAALRSVGGKGILVWVPAGEQGWVHFSDGLAQWEKLGLLELALGAVKGVAQS